jgi:hypothetical protein
MKLTLPDGLGAGGPTDRNEAMSPVRRAPPSRYRRTTPGSIITAVAILGALVALATALPAEANYARPGDVADAKWSHRVAWARGCAVGTPLSSMRGRTPPCLPG